MSIKTDAMIVVGGVALGALVLWYASKKIGDAVSGITDSVTETVSEAYDWTLETVKQTVPYVNPADSRNVIYSGVNGIGGAISGDKTWTLGGWIYDITH